MWLCYIMWLCFGSPSNHKIIPSTHQMKYLRYYLSSIPSLIFLLGRLFISYRLPISGNDEFIYVSSNQCLQLFSSLIFPLFILATSSLSTKNGSLKPVYYLHPHWHPCNSQQYRLLFELLLQFPWWLVLCILQKKISVKWKSDQSLAYSFCIPIDFRVNLEVCMAAKDLCEPFHIYFSSLV